MQAGREGWTAIQRESYYCVHHYFPGPKEKDLNTTIMTTTTMIIIIRKKSVTMAVPMMPKRCLNIDASNGTLSI